MSNFYAPDLGRNPDDPFARAGEGKLIRHGFWLDMSDRSLVLARHPSISGPIPQRHLPDSGAEPTKAIGGAA